MTVKATAPTLAPSASLPSLETASKPLLDLAAKTSAQYKALVTARNAMEVQAGSEPVDEEQFFVAVTKLSEDHTALEQSIQELEIQFASDPKIVQVAHHLRGVLNGDVPAKTMPTASSAPALKPTTVESAENAYSALAHHLESGSTDEQEKEQLGLNLFNAFKEVKKNDDSSFRKSETYQDLSKAYNSLMRTAFAPKMSAPLQESFTNALQTVANTAQEVSTNSNLVQKYVDTQLQEKQMQQQMTHIKRAIAEACNSDTSRTNQAGFLVPNNLFFQHPLFGQISTDLSVALEQFEARFNHLLDKQYDMLLPHINTHYKAKRTKGDGNCLFHTIAHLTKFDHVMARKEVTKHIQENPDLFESVIRKSIKDDPDIADGMQNERGTFVERYVAYMEKDGIWGGNAEIQALSNILGRPIIARQKGSSTKTISFFPTKGKLKTRVPLLILNSGGHFEPLVPRQ